MAKHHPVDTAVSPERAALAQAVAARQDDQAHRESVRTAHAASIERVFACRDAVEQAQAAFEQAKREAVDYAVALARGTAGLAPTSIKSARAHLVEAEDEHASAVATRDALAQQADKVDQSFAPQRLREAAVRVVQTEALAHAHAVAERVAELQIQLVRYGNELQWLAGCGVFPWTEEPGAQYHHVLDPTAAAALNRLASPPISWSELHRIPDLQHHIRWAETMDRLTQDATAALPTGL